MKRSLQILTLLLAAAALQAQTVSRWIATTGNQSLSSSATALTIQQPATNGVPVIVEQIVVYCSAACTITPYQNGTAATSTAGSAIAILPNTAAAPFNVFTSSNVGTGTQQGPVTNIAAGSTVTFCTAIFCGAAASTVIPASGTGSNFTIQTNSVTATVNITLYLRTQQ